MKVIAPGLWVLAKLWHRLVAGKVVSQNRQLLLVKEIDYLGAGAEEPLQLIEDHLVKGLG